MLHHSSREEVTRIATALRSLLAPIFDCYDPLLAHADARELVRRSGCLYVFSSRETAAQWAWGMNLRRSLGVRMQDVEQDELESLEPDLKGRFRFGILAPDNGSTSDPSALVKAIYNRCIGDGARHVRDRVRGFERQGRRVTAMLLEHGEPLAADGVVVAAGAWSGALAAQLDSPVMLETQRGYHVTVQSSNLALRHTVMAVEHNLMVNPMAMGLRLAGTVEFAGLKAPPTWRVPMHCFVRDSNYSRTWTHRPSRAGWAIVPVFPTVFPWSVRSARPTTPGSPSATAIWACAWARRPAARSRIWWPDVRRRWT